mgnify:CR=1 FL=1
MSATRLRRDKTRADFYATPQWVTRAILPHLPRSGALLDPCAGDGAILRVACETVRGGIRAIELDATRADVIARSLPWADLIEGDALDAGATEATEAWRVPHGLVLMNPPFSRAMDFVRRAVSEQAPHGGTTAALLRLSMLAGLARVEFWRDNPCDVYVLPRRPSFTGRGTDSCEYAWFVWGPGRSGRWSVLDVPSAREATR